MMHHFGNYWGLKPECICDVASPKKISEDCEENIMHVHTVSLGHILNPDSFGGSPSQNCSIKRP